MLSADTSWSHTLREDRPRRYPSIFKPSGTNLTTTATAGRNSGAPTDGVSARFTLELHTDLGLVPTETAFERKLVSPESCVNER